MTDKPLLATGPLRPQRPTPEPETPPQTVTPQSPPRRRSKERAVGAYAGKIAITGYVDPATKIDLDAYKAASRLSIVEIVNAAVFDWIARQAFADDYRRRFGEPPPDGWLQEALADWMEKRQAARDFGSFARVSAENRGRASARA